LIQHSQAFGATTWKDIPGTNITKGYEAGENGVIDLDYVCGFDFASGSLELVGIG